MDDKAAQQWVEPDPSDTSATAAVEDYEPGSEAEKKLLRKLDIRIIVCQANLNYICSTDRVASLVAGFFSSWATWIGLTLGMLCCRPQSQPLTR